MAKSYTQTRAEELRILISTVKIKHKLTDQQLAKKIGMKYGTFMEWKSNVGKFNAEKIWLLEVMADK